MNKILPIILVFIFSGCASNSNDVPLEKCADSMFILTNELMAERLPSEAQPEAAIKEFLTQSYDVKTEYDYYNALLKICADQKEKEPEKFKEDYK
tara:strand:- start:317 stop:601 length:285 start_codon:yes stop_codon:yes gene_type:complete